MPHGAEHLAAGADLRPGLLLPRSQQRAVGQEQQALRPVLAAQAQARAPSSASCCRYAAGHQRALRVSCSSSSTPRQHHPTLSSPVLIGSWMAEVVLVRHGETEWNVSGIIQGRIDEELNETGRQQAAMVARRLSEEAKQPAAVYTSDLKRAVQTAKAIAAACLLPDTHLVIDPALTEMHMGLFQGWAVDDAIRSEDYKAYARGGRGQEIPGGGESFDQLSERCVTRLNAIAKKHKGERVVVVSHETVIQEICRHADPTSSIPRKIPNTSISVVHVSGSDGHLILDKIGDAEHLTGDGFTDSASGSDGTSA